MSCKKSTAEGQKAFTKTLNGFTYRLCYLAIAEIVQTYEEEEE